MFENIMKFFNKFNKKQDTKSVNSREAAKERLHLVLMQDRANVSADFLELMKQEIIEVIKKYIDVDESAIDVRLTNKENEDGSNGAPALYANIPIINIKNETRKIEKQEAKTEQKEEKQETKIEQNDEKQENKKQENKKEETNKDEKENKNKEEKQEEKQVKKEIPEEKNKNKIEEDKKKNISEKEEKTEEKIKSNK